MFGKAAPVTVLGYATILLSGLVCATLIVESAAAADLRLPVSPKTQATPVSPPNHAGLYEQFLKWLQTHPR